MFPYYACPLCASFSACIEDKFERREHGGTCFRERRHVNIELQRQHLDELAQLAEVTSQLPNAYQDAILQPVRMAQGRMSRPIEYSVSFTPEEASWYRFSIALRDDDPDTLADDRKELLELFHLFGVEDREKLENQLQSLPCELVRQYLFGVDIRPSGKSRVKVYVRTQRGFGREKAEWLGNQVEDFSEDGLAASLDKLELISLNVPEDNSPTQIKMYFLLQSVDRSGVKKLLGTHPFADFAMARQSVLHELTLIQMAENAKKGKEKVIDEIDLNMPANGFGLLDLLSFVYSQKTYFPLRGFVEMYQSKLILPTFVTFPVRDWQKMNLYYVVLEETRDGRFAHPDAAMFGGVKIGKARREN